MPLLSWRDATFSPCVVWHLVVLGTPRRRKLGQSKWAWTMTSPAGKIKISSSLYSFMFTRFLLNVACCLTRLSIMYECMYKVKHYQLSTSSKCFWFPKMCYSIFYVYAMKLNTEYFCVKNWNKDLSFYKCTEYFLVKNWNKEISFYKCIIFLDNVRKIILYFQFSNVVISTINSWTFYVMHSICDLVIYFTEFLSSIKLAILLQFWKSKCVQVTLLVFT